MEYRRYLTEHLLEFVIPHWDIAIREVAANSMAKIAVLDLDYACSDIIPALVSRQNNETPIFFADYGKKKVPRNDIVFSATVLFA